MGKKIGIVYCERIQDNSCVGCAKCYKAVNEKTFAFRLCVDTDSPEGNRTAIPAL